MKSYHARDTFTFLGSWLLRKPGWRQRTTASTVVSVKKVMVFMSAIGDSLQERLSYLTSVPISRVGICSPLPDEILMTIIEFAAPTKDSCWPRRPALLLSHVCRKFREVTLHLPGIWTGVSLDNHYPAHGLPLRGEEWPCRYRCQRNHVFRGQRRGTTFVSAISLRPIIPYCNEWRSFSYSDIGSNCPELHAAQCPELHAALKLPRLERLRVDGDAEALYSLFDMPILKSARLFDSIPPRPFSTTITHFQVTIATDAGILG